MKCFNLFGESHGEVPDWNKAVVNKGYEGEDNALYCLTPGNPLHSFNTLFFCAAGSNGVSKHSVFDELGRPCTVSENGSPSQGCRYTQGCWYS